MQQKRHFILVADALAMAVIFQNCGVNHIGSSGPNSSGEPSNSSMGSSANDRYAASDVLSGGADANLSDANSILKIVTYSTPVAQTDCSSEDAIVSTEVQNASADIRVCLEYSLDMPVGAPRYGETYLCDSDAKFVKPSTAWVYVASERRWQIPVDRLSNHAYLIPGTYWVAIKDVSGVVYKSNPMVIKRANVANCLVGNTGSANSNSNNNGSSARTCNWSGGITIGLASNYAVEHNRSCVTGNETYQYTDSQGTTYNYLCVCR